MPSQDPSRPNVLLVLTDDQGYWAMGNAGNAEIRTPNLDKLAQTGIRFDNFFCVSPVCSPARASLLTGRIPSQHGVHDWIRAGNARTDPHREGRLVEYLKGLTGYSDVLAAQGYHCAMSGKWHMGDSHHPQKGFSYWQVHATGGGPYYDAPMIRGDEVVRQEGYVTDVITDNALRFLDAEGARSERTGNDTPFYLSVHYTAPHSPWDRDNHPNELYDDYRATCAFDSLPREPMHPWQINSAPFGYHEEKRRDILSGYFTAVTAMDANLGRLLDWLEAQGLRENTLVFFTSDNGMNMGHHGIYGKGNGTFPQNMYDTSVKVPALFSRPGHVPQGTVEEGMYSHYDYMPTLLDYLGLECPDSEELPGQSFAPLLRGEPCPERQAVVVTGGPCDAVYDEYGPVRMIRTSGLKYVHRYPYGPHEFYDLVSDPDERENLVDHPAHQAQIEALKAQLDAWFVRFVVPARDGVREPVTGKGQLGLVGPAGKGEPNFADDWYYLRSGDQTRIPDDRS